MSHISKTTASARTPFDAAVKDFQDELSDKEEFIFQGIETIHDVYREIERTQEEQGRTRQLRNMKKIAPFLTCLEEYSGVLETFVQAKASVLALIWVGITNEASVGNPLMIFIRDQSSFCSKYYGCPIVNGGADSIQVSRNYLKGFDKVLEMTRKIGDCLPQFKKCEGLFKDNKGVQDILCLFYKDILDFYAIMLRFFQTKGTPNGERSD